MGICIDQSTKFLKGLGYNVVRLPRQGIAPLQLIGVQNGDAQYLGDLSGLVLAGGGALPTLRANERAGDVNGQRSSELSAAIGVNILAAIVGSMGGNLGIKAYYKSAKTVTFEYTDVTGDAVAPLDVGQYLRGAQIDVENPIIEQYVLGNGRLYLITRTLKSTKFRTVVTRSDGGSVAAEIPEIQKVVGGNIEVKADSKDSTGVTYEGKVPLVFGFQCLDVGVYDGVLTLENTTAGSIAMDDKNRDKRPILAPEGLLNVR